jgi:chemotaxis response regulator CheB
MSATAYEFGVQLALRDMGLVKESASVGGLRELVSPAAKAIKDYLTLAAPRKALKTVAHASRNLEELGKDIPLRRAWAQATKYTGPTRSRVGKMNKEVSRAASKLLEDTLRRTRAGEKALSGAKKNALRSAIPYLVPAVGVGAGYGGYKGLQALFPNWKAIQPEPPSLWNRLAGGED